VAFLALKKLWALWVTINGGRTRSIFEVNTIPYSMRTFIAHSKDDKYSQPKRMPDGQKLVLIYYVIFYSTHTLLAKFLGNMRLYIRCTPSILAYESGTNLEAHQNFGGVTPLTTPLYIETSLQDDYAALISTFSLL